jgi:hypothetical protein
MNNPSMPPVSGVPLSANFEPWDLLVVDGDFDEAFPFRVLIYWGLVGGRWEPSDITIRTLRIDITGPITSTVLRQVPVGRLVDRARAEHYGIASTVAFKGEPHQGFVEPWQKGETPRLGIDHYQKVAEVYKTAFAAGASPTKAVAEYYKVSASTAASWVSRARNRYELLPKTIMGRASI